MIIFVYDDMTSIEVSKGSDSGIVAIVFEDSNFLYLFDASRFAISIYFQLLNAI